MRYGVSKATYDDAAGTFELYDVAARSQEENRRSDMAINVECIHCRVGASMLYNVTVIRVMWGSYYNYYECNLYCQSCCDLIWWQLNHCMWGSLLFERLQYIRTVPGRIRVSLFCVWHYLNFHKQSRLLVNLFRSQLILAVSNQSFYYTVVTLAGPIIACLLRAC